MILRFLRLHTDSPKKNSKHFNRNKIKQNKTMIDMLTE